MIEIFKEFLKSYQEKTKLVTNHFENILIRHINDYNYKEGEICIFNTNISRELIEYSDLVPVYMIGGSLGFKNTYDDLFPRDVDKIVHSSYLYFKEYTKNYKGTVRAVIVLQNDSYRKLAALLEDEGIEVVKIDLFQVDITDKSYLTKILKTFTWNLNNNFFKVPTKRLTVLVEFYSQVRKLHVDLYELHAKYDCLSAYDYYLITYTYYLTRDIQSYFKELKTLVDNIQRKEYQQSTIKVSLLGSPLYLPNTKIIDIFESFNVKTFISENELNINLYQSIDTSFGLKAKPYEYLTKIYFFSGKNLFLINNQISKDINTEYFDGLLYISLKGQVTYDFNHDKYEEAYDDIALLKIETDYFNEDKEQLKIRIEAFVEMLRELKKG